MHARELIAYRAFGLGVLMSVYKEGELAGRPVGLQEYYAQYPDDSGDLLVLAMPISTVRPHFATSPIAHVVTDSMR